MAFYAWAPWSLLLHLLPFVLLAAVAALGTRWVMPLVGLNAVLVGLATYAAWCLYASITGNPSSSTVERVFLDPYFYCAVLGLFGVINFRPALYGLENLFYRHSVETTILPAISPTNPTHSMALSASLMPHLDEIIDLRETVSYYQHQAKQMRELTAKLEAEKELAEAIIRSERMRRHSNNES